MNTLENDEQEKKDLKKYSIHQKINTRIIGLEIFNQNIAVPYSAYLVCKLVYKEDIQSLKEIEEVIFEITSIWEKEQQEMFIKKINVVTSEKYFILTFSLGFFQKEQSKKLPEVKEWVKNRIENHTKVLLQRKKLESDLFKKLSTQIEQLERKIDKIEYRIKKSETVIIDSNKKLEKEVVLMNQLIEIKVMNSLETDSKNIVDKNQVNANLSTHTYIHEKRSKRFYLVRGKNEDKVMTKWKTININLNDVQVNNREEDRINNKKHLSEYERKIIYYFREIKTSEKKQMVPQKKFLEWQAKIEYIDYLWKMFESENQSELVIDENLSCKSLIKELPTILAMVEELSKSTKLFNYWIYCPQVIMVKLKGYVVLAEYLASITDNTETFFIIS